MDKDRREGGGSVKVEMGSSDMRSECVYATSLYSDRERATQTGRN